MFYENIGTCVFLMLLPSDERLLWELAGVGGKRYFIFGHTTLIRLDKQSRLGLVALLTQAWV
jgi:hypothetical protein